MFIAQNTSKLKSKAELFVRIGTVSSSPRRRINVTSHVRFQTKSKYILLFSQAGNVLIIDDHITNYHSSIT